MTRAEYWRVWRKANPAKAAEYQRRYYEKIRAERDTEKDAPCTDCGGSFPPECMEWDHLPGTEKLTKVSAVSALKDAAKRAAEIAKCELVCANCHAIRTKARWRMGVDEDD